MSDHTCDGECIICNRETCEFCGAVSNVGFLYCYEHILEADNEEEE